MQIKIIDKESVFFNRFCRDNGLNPSHFTSLKLYYEQKAVA